MHIAGLFLVWQMMMIGLVVQHWMHDDGTWDRVLAKQWVEIDEGCSIKERKTEDGLTPSHGVLTHPSRTQNYELKIGPIPSLNLVKILIVFSLRLGKWLKSPKSYILQNKSNRFLIGLSVFDFFAWSEHKCWDWFHFQFLFCMGWWSHRLWVTCPAGSMVS